jgi:hypothetical protein
MTDNNINQPFERFHVQSNLLQNAAAATSPGRQGNGGGNTPAGNFHWNEARWLATIVFGAIYWVAQRDPQLRPMTILVLLACLLFRMEGRTREIAGVPLTLAAIKLAYQMTPSATLLPGTQLLMSEQMKAAWTGLPWVPMFLAICLFYLPKKSTVTGSIIRAGAIGLLISGLIPGEGYVVVLGMIQYTLFLGVLIGLIADHPWNGAAANTGRAIPAAHA